MLLQFFAEADIEAAHNKESHNQGDEHQVTHNKSRFSRPQRAITLAWAVIKTGAEDVKKVLKCVAGLRMSDGRPATPVTAFTKLCANRNVGMERRWASESRGVQHA